MGTAGKPEIESAERVTRRHRSKQERRQIAEESLQAGVSVAVVARRHGVNANQVFHWRKLLSQGRLDVKPPPAQLMPVRITGGDEERPMSFPQQSGDPNFHKPIRKLALPLLVNLDPTHSRQWQTATPDRSRSAISECEKGGTPNRMIPGAIRADNLQPQTCSYPALHQEQFHH